jgi:uncharacterized membrane protein YhhN
MTLIAIVFSALCAAFVVGLLFAEKQQNERLRWIFKPAASLSFVVVGLGSDVLGSTYGIMILAGLVLCLGGDVLLIPKKETTFLAGLGSFLLGHLAFAAAFAGLQPAPVQVAVGVAIALAVAVPAMRFIYPHVPRDMKIPVIAYVLVICSMVGTAWGAWQAGATWLIPVGAFAFLLSDLSVALDRFVGEKFINRLWGMPLYFGSVVLIALTPSLISV